MSLSSVQNTPPNAVPAAVPGTVSADATSAEDIELCPLTASPLADSAGSSTAASSGSNPVPMTSAEKVRRAITKVRLPLAILGLIGVIALLDSRQYFAHGALVSLFGEAIQLWASSHVHRKERRLTTSGPYACVRNPMYIGRFFYIGGFFVMTGLWWLCALYAVLFAAYAHVRVKREEKFLDNLFGAPYREYCAHVRSWLPGSPWSKAEVRRASWEQVRVNHEHFNLFILLGLLLLIHLRIDLLPPIF